MVTLPEARVASFERIGPEPEGEGNVFVENWLSRHGLRAGVRAGFWL